MPQPPMKLIIPLAVIFMIISSIHSFMTWITDSGPEPKTQEQVIEDNRHQAMLAGVQRAIDKNNVEAVRKFLDEGLPVDAVLGTYYQRKTLLTYVMSNWDVTNGAFSTRPSRRYQPVGQGYYAPESYFRFRQKRTELVDLLVSRGADINALVKTKALDIAYIPLLEALKRGGWDETEPMYYQRDSDLPAGDTPLMHVAYNHPKVEFEDADICRNAGKPICKAIKHKMIFDWLLDAPGVKIGEVNHEGQNLLFKSIRGARSEADALFRLKFWKDKGLSTCLRDKEQMAPEDYMLRANWLEAYEQAKCATWAS